MKKLKSINTILIKIKHYGGPEKKEIICIIRNLEISHLLGDI